MVSKTTKEEELKSLMEFLEETRFNFACFVDSFKRYIDKLENENK